MRRDAYPLRWPTLLANTMPRAGVQVRFLKTWLRSPNTSPRDLSHRRSSGRCEGNRLVTSAASSGRSGVMLATLSICASPCHMDGTYLERPMFVTRTAASLYVGRRYDIPSCDVNGETKEMKQRNANSKSMKTQCSQNTNFGFRGNAVTTACPCSKAPICLRVRAARRPSPLA